MLSGNNDLTHLGKHSLVVEDLYSLKQLLFESDIEPKTYYLERVEGQFERPSFLIKIVNFANVPYNDYMSWIDEDVLIQYMASSMLDAQATSARVMNLLTRTGVGVKDVILPRYDFSTEPPTKIPVSYRDISGNIAFPSNMGTRIDPTSVRCVVAQEPDERWSSAITFTMRSPSIPCRDPGPVIRHMEITRIGACLPVEFPETGIDLTTDVSTDIESNT